MNKSCRNVMALSCSL